MTEKTPINEEAEIAWARSLVAYDWTPFCLTTPGRGLDIRDWIDAVRVLLKRLDAHAIALGSLIDEATALKTGRVNTIDAALDRARKALGQGTEH